MFCPKCGKKLSEGALFCGNCGFNIANAKSAEKASSEQVKQVENVKKL